MVKTYILAPNWTTSPPPDGPIRLGHLLDDLTELVPLNRDGVVHIPPDCLERVDTKTGFQTSRGKLLSSELGIFTKVVGAANIGIGMSTHYKKGTNDVLCCKSLDTVAFDPTAEYIAESMNHPAIIKFMQGCRFKSPVYMITGLKISRGGSLQSTDSRDVGARLRNGITPPGSGVDIEGGGALMRQKLEGESWEGSTDFIVAFRVRKIWYHRASLRSKAYLKNAVMQDGTFTRAGPRITLQADDQISLEDLIDGSSDMDFAMETGEDGGEEVNWIIPIAVPQPA